MRINFRETEWWLKLCRMGGLRFVVLVALLAVLSLVLMVVGRADSEALDPVPAGYEERLPTLDRILDYLDGKTIPILEPSRDPGEETSLTLEKERIEGLAIRRDGVSATEARFQFRTARQRYQVKVAISQFGSDGRFYCEGLHTISVSRN